MEAKSYFHYGFLDFLVYFVPGVFVILSFLILNYTFEIGFSIPDLSTVFETDAYIRGAIWTVLAIIVPYVLGHLIFPLGYVLSKIVKVKPQSGNYIRCQDIKDGKYCKIESFEFTKCLFDCQSSATLAFNEFMITRFRTLSRFCRAMLFPVLLLGFSLFGLAIKTESGFKCTLWILGAAFLLSLLGFAIRFRAYEKRWRNAVCTGSGERGKI